jgi:fatty acid desaturase
MIFAAPNSSKSNPLALMARWRCLAGSASTSGMPLERKLEEACNQRRKYDPCSIDVREGSVLNCRNGDGAVRHLDVAVMFASLWLLASMVIDAITPPELTVYLIGATIAPAIVILALLYWKRVSRFDFAVAFATLWMTTSIALELISPKPLSLLVLLVAIAPLVIVGAVVHFRRWRDSRPPSGSKRVSP